VTTPRLRPSRAFLVIGWVVVVSFLAAAMVLGQSLRLDTARSDARQTQRGFALIWDAAMTARSSRSPARDGGGGRDLG
jgi:hypothetical protein